MAIRLVHLPGGCMYSFLRRLFAPFDSMTEADDLDPDWSNWTKSEAMEVLKAELGHFSYDGLTQLRESLSGEGCLIADWNGCPLSYRNGSAGSVGLDTQGQRQNAFTYGWDEGEITGEEVLAAVELELLTRQVERISPQVECV